MKIKNINRGMLSRLVAVAAIALCCVMALPTVVHAEDVPENKNEFHIKNEADFLSCVALSRERDTSGWYVYLDNDIELDSDDMKAIVANTVKHLSFGNKEHPFKGVFDGQNHTVEGLNYDKDAFDPERDTGFFAETNGATIKNFLVKDANVWADFRGGIIVGKAVNTRFENVMVMESTLHVTCANNALNLITNAGFEGGLIAGELDGCTLYNCEVRGGRAVNNTTSGVQALGGEGLYMAAFAGYVTNSTIEYCRVTPTRNGDGSVAKNGMTDVTNKYDVAVGALGGNNVYASGFVGCMAGNAKIIDCFSTAQCYSYAASYVGVVAVTRAWTGGLAGRILTEKGNELVRSHFAGDLSSRQYNPIAVIPIIQNDVNLGGIAARANKGDATVTECYFKPSVSLKGSSQGNPAKKKIPSFGGDGTTKGDGYGPWDDERYTTRELWEEHDYDFCAGTMRSTDNDDALGGQHPNEWAMDYTLNIPVHGQSVKATIDFPGAGTATIEATKLGIEQKTSDPYAFAVSAVLAGTAQGLAQGDTSVTFRQDTSAKPEGLSKANDGYRFMGWFREPDVRVNRIGQDNSWFDGKTDAAAVAADKRVEENTAHDKASTYTADNGSGVDEKFGFKGNDLFIASYEAQVLFYNVKGETLDWKTGDAHDKSVDWYRYGVDVTPTAPADREGLSDSATFIGWTSQPSNEAGKNGAYAAITSTQLADLKNKGAFYPAGSEITVVGPTDFYPVYSDYVSNILTEFEGHDPDDKTKREGVGKTYVKVGTAEDGTSAYTVQVLDVSGNAISKDGTLPDGYRFLGWYENKGTEDAPLEVRVSRDPSYTLPADVDLTAPHTYIARFEYRVDYYVRAYTNHEFTDSKLLCSVWNRYQTPFEENVGSTFVRENVVHWGPEHVDHGIKDSYETCGTRFTKETLVVSPLNAYSHNVKNDTGADTLKNLYADTDFPGAATLSDTWTSASLNVTVKPVNDRYRLNFWTLERDGEYWTYVKNPIESMVRTDKKYYVRAMITTDVNFYNKGDNVVRTATRRYESNLLQAKVNGADPTFTYYYPHVNTSVEAKGKPQDGLTGSYESPLTLESSPTDAEMAVPGYKFLGWISTAEVQKDSAVWNYIYDVAGDSFTTSDPDKAEPYLVKPDFKVTQWQDAYPVYAKYDVRYTTNLYRAGFKGTDKVNVPRYDIDPVINAGTDPATATVTPDVTTPVYKAGGELYKLQKVEIELPNGEVEEIEPNGDNSYSHQVEPGGAYTFVAYYSPLAVVYHLNAKDVDGKVAQQGDMLGNLDGGIPKPTYDVSAIDRDTGGAFNAFVGWTEAKPAPVKGYVAWSEGIRMVSASTVVRAPMELYPVYRPSLVTVQSNIDLNLANPALVRGLGRTDSGDQISLEVKAVKEVVGIDGTKYDFVGWSRDYVNDGQYTLMTDDEKYPLEGSEPFESVTYTAVYKKTPLKVRYHDTEGNVIYTATVDPNDTSVLRGQDGNAGFVQTVKVPKMYENGNPVYDDKGEPVMEPKEVAYDPEAYSAIVAFLGERADSSLKELFLEWQWVNGDKAVAWSDFKGKPVTANMDLYPVTYRVVANDTSDDASPKNVTGQLKWLLDPNAANTIDDKSDKAPFKACFAKPFMGTQLTVHVDRVGYGLPGQTPAPVNGKYVSLYSSGSGEGSFELTNRLDYKLTGDGTQSDGNAVFDFAATHTLKIVKQTQDSWAKGKTFRFKVSRAGMDGNALEERTVEVTVSSDAQLKDGSAWYSGAIELAVPAGIYTVEEDSAWAWRYSNKIGVPGKQPGDKAQATISAASSANDATFTCTNTRVNDKWIDGSKRAHNVWSNGNVAKKED
ncbi:hypothetical protein [Collinsella aerofaciens]|uniref:hypothetical protein n=1 Tax=Collinsella aerofaciens TaxID=74426 RepID=UPI00232AA700|nr:hypothetical protein [Collinsella aerofaciens]MDB1818818.1 hypothetical protein [Collinsella aerofaciens]MDB1822507.1 hypothetical protein [Collinsella aerofaciens]MDB1824456.1 hypothetical protein [Collinsella aerofaciens]MDB1826217.1 hypothetical protein [Collinsella aerofaciens]MDC0806630.1 hypothetical protein [Collinsella aerofaciens]